MLDEQEHQQLESLAAEIKHLSQDDAFHMGTEYEVLNDPVAIADQSPEVAKILGRINDGVRDLLVEAGGAADKKNIKSLRKMGIDVQMAGDPEDLSHPCIQIKLPDGTLQYEVDFN